MLLKSTIKIKNKSIGPGCPAFIIAEMSANHGGDLLKAMDIIHAAKEAGADAIKLQTYRADTLTLKCKAGPFYIKAGAWKGQYLYDLYEKAAMPWNWHEKLMAEAEKVGIILFSTPFDFSAVDLLESLDMPAYKIASPEIIDLPLIRRVARTGKPIIISTGNATLEEMNQALTAAVDEGAKEIGILKCTSSYPAPPEDINLKTIPHMHQIFKCPVGISDHSLGIGVPVASVAFGAAIIEKHFILDRTDESVDNFFSITPDELKMMVENVRIAEKAIGHVSYPLKPNPAQRSLIVTEPITAGGRFHSGNIKSLRPGGGLPPKFYDLVLRKKAIRNLKRGELLSWDMIGD